MSDIFGTGWGSDHEWIRGGTNQVGNAYMFKASYYGCKDCGVHFAHSYDIYPDIFHQMQVLGVPEHCSKAPEVSNLTELQANTKSRAS